jgi:1-acyl-sn-glycerol-3-phosphate acyltransferase
MTLFRSTLYFCTMVLATVIIATLIVLLFWLPYDIRSRLANVWGMVNLWLLRVICNLRYEVRGWEHIPAGGCIFLAKHQSAWETIALRGLLPHNQIWVLKRELMWVPFFGWALYLVKAISIDRGSGRQAAKKIVEEGTRHLEAGRYVVIFPEGTRVAPGQRKRYGIGGAFLAQKSGSPVVPIAHNAGVFWRRRDLRKYPGTIQVVIGPPIATQGLSSTEINQKVEEWIESTMEELPSTIDIKALEQE